MRKLLSVKSLGWAKCCAWWENWLALSSFLKVGKVVDVVVVLQGGQIVGRGGQIGWRFFL